LGLQIVEFMVMDSMVSVFLLGLKNREKLWSEMNTVNVTLLI
jgi:hypothetical protein